MHDDPMVASPLRDWLAQCKAQHPSSPAFVAVEWYAGVLDQVLTAWSELHRLMARDWGVSDGELHETVLESVAFEAIAADEVFGRDLILWLERDRRFENLGAEVYSWHWARVGRRRPDLTGLSVLARAMAEKSARRPERDGMLADRLLEHMNGNGWAIAILGASHCSNCWPDTTRNLVADRGHQVDAPKFFGFEPCLQ